MRHALLACASLSAIIATPAAAEEADTGFALGQIIVTGRQSDGVAIGMDSVGREALEAFNRTTVDDAVKLIPGVTSSNSGGSRNERLIFVRGFDRFQVPLSIDGIRVYLPADNRLDFGRFLTADLAEVQVAKGYASVLDGPGAMGGAVNLVTRKPTRAFEAEARGTLTLDRDAGYSGYNVFGLVGTRQDTYYAQASFTRSFRDHWDLPGSYEADRNEDGGEREFSRTEDRRLNVKAGFTPNATDEYSLSYTRQEGSKQAPLHISSDNNRVLRNWTWPEWDIESLYFLSTTQIADEAALKLRAFKSNYDNMLRSYDDTTHTTQTLGRAFDSPYDDTALGGSVQLDMGLAKGNRLSVAAHFRRDEHNESQTSRPDVAGATPEPNQQSLENTWSIAAEDRQELGHGFVLTLGASYDWRFLEKAEEYDEDLDPALYEFPHKSAEGWNVQGRLDWTGPDGVSAYASVSSRIRFPTLFERFSSQFGTAEPNPGLDPERATNFEVGGAKQLGPLRLSVAVFYNHLTDVLVTIRTEDDLNRRENIGSADYAGGEIGLDAQLLPSLQAGVNYSYIHRSFDLGDAPEGGFIRKFRLTDVPEHTGFAWLKWEALPGLTILPSLEFASDRMTVEAATASGDTPAYYELDGYVTASLRVDYAVSDQLSFGIGADNLFDEYYLLTDGFPEAGRSLFLTASARY